MEEQPAVVEIGLPLINVGVPDEKLSPAPFPKNQFFVSFCPLNKRNENKRKICEIVLKAYW